MKKAVKTDPVTANLTQHVSSGHPRYAERHRSITEFCQQFGITVQSGLLNQRKRKTKPGLIHPPIEHLNLKVSYKLISKNLNKIDHQVSACLHRKGD